MTRFRQCWWAIALALTIGIAAAQPTPEAGPPLRAVVEEPREGQTHVLAPDRALFARVAVSETGELWPADGRRWVKLILRRADARPVTVELFDDGMAPDERPGDGVWTGSIPGSVPPGEYTTRIALRWAEEGRLSEAVWRVGPSFRIAPADRPAPPEGQGRPGAASVWHTWAAAAAVLVVVALGLLALARRMRELAPSGTEPDGRRTPEVGSDLTPWARLFRHSGEVRDAAQELYVAVGKVREDYEKLADVRQNLRSRVARVILEAARLGPGGYPVEVMVRRLGQALEDHDPEALADAELRAALKAFGMVFEE